jgi:hypothetical protein
MATSTSFSGGEVRQGNAIYGTEVWNRDPLPPPVPPKVYMYKLTVRSNTGGEAVATAKSMEILVAFEMQMRDLDYEFIKLERLDTID